jgi:hypothetical protein
MPFQVTVFEAVEAVPLVGVAETSVKLDGRVSVNSSVGLSSCGVVLVFDRTTV